METEFTSEVVKPFRCPLCGNQKVVFYHRDRAREYHQCVCCYLVFVPIQFHLSIDLEKKEYDHHENSTEDEGYLRFLSRFSTPFLDRLGKSKNGLDFGCGPAPALAQQLEDHGHSVTLYDPMYRDNNSVLKMKYDFISSTEVVEHFSRPQIEFELLFNILKPGGWLGLMTKMVRDQSAFTSWHYIRDLTHISFYSRETFLYIGKNYGAEVTFVSDDVIFLQKNDLK